MSGTGEPGPVEEARGPGWDAFAKAWGERRDMGQCYAAAFEVWQHHVAALVAQARADGAAEERERMDVQTWRPGDGDTRCQDCGRLNPVWFTDSELWNAVMGGEYGILCPICFMVRAHKQQPRAWHVGPDRDPS